MTGFELVICLLISVASYAYRRSLSGLKNATFYAKGSKLPPARLLKYIRNLHFLETPAWYSQAGQFFPLIYLIGRYEAMGVLLSLALATILTLSASAIAGPFYQCPINLSAGKDCIDPTENPKSEFAWGPISFWWPRPWRGYYRIIGACFGLLATILSIIFVLYREL